MLSPALLLLALFGPALAPAPRAEGATPRVEPSAGHGELRPIAWRDAPRARAPLAIAAPAAAPQAAELREPFDVAPTRPTASTMAVDPWALREPFSHAAPAAAPAPAPAAEPVAPRHDAAGLREPAWAR